MRSPSELMTAPALAALLLAQPGVVEAAPLDLEWLPPETSWVVHVDVEAVFDSFIGELVLDGHIDDISDTLEEVENELGVNPTRDVLSVTVYGSDTLGEDGVVIIRATNVVDDLIDRFEDEADEHDVDFRELEVDGEDLYSWSYDGEGKMYSYVGEVGRDDRVIVVAESKSEVSQAVKVLKGRVSNYTDRDDTKVDIKPRSGSLVYVNLSSLDDLPNFGEHSEIARQAEGLSLDVGELDDEIRIELKLTTGSEELANEISDVLTGMMALGRILKTEDPEIEAIMELTRGISVRTRGGDLQLRLEVDTDDMMKVMEMIE